MKRCVAILCLLLSVLFPLTACVRTRGKGSAEISASARVEDFHVRLTSMHTVYDLDAVNPAHPLKIKLHVRMVGDDFARTVWVTGDSWYSFRLDGVPDLYHDVVDPDTADEAPPETDPPPAATAVRMTKADQTLHIWQGEDVVERLNALGRKLEPGDYTVTANLHIYLDEALTEPLFCSLQVPITLK